MKMSRTRFGWLLAFCLALVTAPALAKSKRTRATIAPAELPKILEAVKKPGARAVLLNVWATWCDPCREEMPDIVRLYKEHKDRGLRLVLISADGKDERAAAEKFLTEQGVDFPSFLKVGNDQDFLAGLDKRWNGTLPGSFLYDDKGNVQHVWSGQVTYAALKEKLEPLLTGNK